MKKMDLSTAIRHLKNNWYFLLSSVAFFCLYSSRNIVSLAGLAVAAVFLLLLAAQMPSVWKMLAAGHPVHCVVSALTAIGICLFAREQFHYFWGSYTKILWVGAFGTVNALFFVYTAVFLFWKELSRLLSDGQVFADVKAGEWLVYGLLLAATLVLVVGAFAQTDAFYGTTYDYDIIYTADSPSLVKENVYLLLNHGENDLRQPLFAVFAAPFVGIPYLLGRVLGASPAVQAMLLNGVQVVLLVFSHFLLARMMKLSAGKRVCFLLLTCCTYTHLLFALMMEQYIIAYFWLILCMFLICERKQLPRLALWGAGGTLLTSMVLLPFLSDKSPVKQFKAWFGDMVKYGLEFVVVVLAFYRYDVVLNLTKNAASLSGYAGQNLSGMQKFRQYTEFVRNCFAAPNAGVSDAVTDHISWQLAGTTGVSVTGIAILLLVAISAYLNRDKKSSLLAAGWAAFSLVMLWALGWGTNENGLILYALYFGWAFLVLLFQLAAWIENRLKGNFLVPVVSVGGAAVLAAVNIPAILKMVTFAIAHFPV